MAPVTPYCFLRRSVSLSTSACCRLRSFSSASNIFLIRFCSSRSARSRSFSSFSTSTFSLAVSWSISHCVRGSTGGGRAACCCGLKACCGGICDAGTLDGGVEKTAPDIVGGDPAGLPVAITGPLFFLFGLPFVVCGELILNISLLALKKMSLITAAPKSRTTSRPLTSSTSTLCIFGWYIVRSTPLYMATVISGSLFFLPSVDFPDK